jgi:hypothetical protein
MKRGFTTMSLLLLSMFMLLSATNRTADRTTEIPVIKKKNCTGYTVIEANKGIDCNGDTVTLRKTRGYFELASRSTESITSPALASNDFE